ncbi:MAG: class I SAM-dependent methyltransferase [Chloroflexi bacterium]|nr:class I SAM-dependent methyltransferase [Chloroflexota bacterium]
MSISDSRRSSAPFDSTYRETPPWDIGEPQPALLALLDEYPPTGPVLDVGCGTGELALALAQRGLAVLGVDLAEAAITQARAKAATAAPGAGRWVEFRVGDALHPTLLPGPFGAVVDSGFFHLFGPLERERFAHELAAALAPGGRYYLLGFAIASPLPNAPRQVLESELRALFAPERGWRVLALRPARFLIRSARSNDVPAIAACVERAT